MNPTAVVNYKSALSARHCSSEKAQASGKRKVIPKGLAGWGIAQPGHRSIQTVGNLMAQEPSSGISTTARTQRERHQTGNGAAEHHPNQKEQLEGGQHEQRGVDTG